MQLPAARQVGRRVRQVGLGDAQRGRRVVAPRPQLAGVDLGQQMRRARTTSPTRTCRRVTTPDTRDPTRTSAPIAGLITPVARITRPTSRRVTRTVSGASGVSGVPRIAAARTAIAAAAPSPRSRAAAFTSRRRRVVTTAVCRPDLSSILRERNRL